MTHTLALSLPHGMEWIVIGIIALLLFGRRLPEVARSVGRGIVEFKKGIKGIEDDLDTEPSRPTHQLETDRRSVSQQPSAGQPTQEPIQRSNGA